MTRLFEFQWWFGVGSEKSDVKSSHRGIRPCLHVGTPRQFSARVETPRPGAMLNFSLLLHNARELGTIADF